MTVVNSVNSKVIMVIEDNCLTLNQLRDYLYENGYRVVPCKHSSEAVTLLGEIIPDLIILDIIMPEFDGYDFCRWIRTQSRLKRVPIIFLTARDSLEDKLVGLKIGADDYLTKPFAYEELLARIKVIINRMDSFYELSMRDELTDAFNRRYFNERLEEEVHRAKRNGRPFSVIILDIDSFKQINDNYGHKAGDELLIQFVRFLQSRLRKSDLIARLGGDEFVLLLPDTESEKSFLLVERLRKSLEETMFFFKQNCSGEVIRTTMSAGISCCPHHSDEASKLLHLADNALYSAKKAGRNRTRIADSLKN